MSKMSKDIFRWHVLSMPTHVVLSGRYLKVGRAFPNLIYVEIGVRGKRRKFVEREGFM